MIGQNRIRVASGKRLPAQQNSRPQYATHLGADDWVRARVHRGTDRSIGIVSPRNHIDRARCPNAYRVDSGPQVPCDETTPAYELALRQVFGTDGQKDADGPCERRHVTSPRSARSANPQYRRPMEPRPNSHNFVDTALSQLP